MSKTKEKISVEADELPLPTPWPNANARLLGLGVGLPVTHLNRLAQFSATDFERFTLEWADGYLKQKLPSVSEVQQRGGAGDKGRDVIVYFDGPSVSPRRWSLYQCKHYSFALGAPTAVAEIAKVLFYTYRGDYTAPLEYWFITHKGVTSPFQDLLDDPATLGKWIINNWPEHCAKKITTKETISLSPELLAHIQTFDFSIFRAKQPQDLINEHRQTRYHLTVFGAPLIDRPPPPTPPSSVAPSETEYIRQVYEVIAEATGGTISTPHDFADMTEHVRLFDRSRLTFYCAEGVKELARDQMADTAFFDTLLTEFVDGLYYDYTEPGLTGYKRLTSTIKAAQALQLGGHVLADHVRANDREGMCHQMANERRVTWVQP